MSLPCAPVYLSLFFSSTITLNDKTKTKLYAAAAGFIPAGLFFFFLGATVLAGLVSCWFQSDTLGFGLPDLHVPCSWMRDWTGLHK
jgi:hypothetical protein